MRNNWIVGSKFPNVAYPVFLRSVKEAPPGFQFSEPVWYSPVPFQVQWGQRMPAQWPEPALCTWKTNTISKWLAYLWKRVWRLHQASSKLNSSTYQTMDRWSVDTQVLGTAVTFIKEKQKRILTLSVWNWMQGWRTWGNRNSSGLSEWNAH